MLKKIFKAKYFSLALTVFCLIVMTTVSVYAADYDLTGGLTTAAVELQTQVMGIIGVVVPVVLAIVGAKVAISKGISVFKSLTGKG